ncbi:MAG TPA: hypothetical protein VGG62_06605 [Terracidiphilus sp.]
MAVEARQSVPAKSTRLAGFANFFKGYMSVSTIVAAAIPIPVGSLKLIPVFSQQRGFLTVYASLFCFLLLAFVFSIRHRLAGPMFAKGPAGALIAALPFVFIVLTLGSVIAYHAVLLESIEQLRLRGLTFSTDVLLEKVDATEIPYAVELAACYLGIFIFAESAFVLMAIREYLQDLLRLDEVTLLRGTPEQTEAGTESRLAAVPDAPSARG